MAWLYLEARALGQQDSRLPAATGRRDCRLVAGKRVLDICLPASRGLPQLRRVCLRYAQASSCVYLAEFNDRSASVCVCVDLRLAHELDARAPVSVCLKLRHENKRTLQRLVDKVSLNCRSE